MKTPKLKNVSLQDFNSEKSAWTVLYRGLEAINV